ncbi:PAS domain S-box-containing protein [Yoonia maricola]|uniref:PAS domain S-box-containing protein n=1 Tax=Yoonia maricola TaxID=420999 RepID=A0A2M8WKT6_9RHOB|nr:PAS domain-containing protein [Yoonia maricola]PJI91527.1 PAS domain S-box-containing protein [Yoonia maricola]
MTIESDSYDVFIRDHADEDTRNAAIDSSAVVCLAAPGVPVLYVSDVFEAHTGYTPTEIVGRSLSILQGPDTEPEAVALFRKLIEEAKPGLIKITNYRKDGTPFTHECALRPISDSNGTVTHFVAIQKPVVS